MTPPPTLESSAPSGLLARIGIPPSIAWGFAGVFLFMIGIGLEISWLSPYLTDQGISVSVVASIFSVYGISVSISSWISGVVFEIIGAKRTMLLAFVLFAAGTAVFVGIGVQQQAVWALFVGYAIKGFSYPLFSYSFLVWIAYRAVPERLSTAYGWFWVAFSGGMSVVGAYGSGLLIDAVGPIPVLWSTVLFAGLGTAAIVLLNRDDITPKPAPAADRWLELFSLVTILRDQPRLALVIGIRIVNTLPLFAMPVFMPLYLEDYGFTTAEWLAVWGTTWLANIAFNLVFGYLGDQLGWKRVISFVGGIGCALSTLAFFYAPQVLGHNFTALMIAGLCLGACVAGYIPLDAIVANFVEDNKGAAISVMNFGAGLSTLVGPLIVAIFAEPFGYTSVAWVLAGLYLAVGVVIWYLVPRTAATNDTDAATTAEATEA
ncbi:MFS transporter [Tsukamurella sp. USMM236]|uniref:MFS transporter n=1 Tax=Tsukamurella sp. USMM236 TaxID=3081301 RepID=UPI00301B5AE1